VDEALRTGALAIEAPVVTRGRPEPMVVVARAIVDRSGRPVGVVSQSTRLVALGPWLQRDRALPAELVITVTSPDGTVLSRSRVARCASGPPTRCSPRRRCSTA